MGNPSRFVLPSHPALLPSSCRLGHQLSNSRADLSNSSNLSLESHHSCNSRGQVPLSLPSLTAGSPPGHRGNSQGRCSSGQHSSSQASLNNSPHNNSQCSILRSSCEELKVLY